MTDVMVQLGQPFSLLELEAIAARRATLTFGQSARERVRAARGFVKRLADLGNDAPNVYGVNTGFGALAETRIDDSEIEALQHNLLRSHACGVGDDLWPEAVRAMIALRAQVLALGHSGVREELIDTLLLLLERDVLPRIPSQGSVGASGDLAPLAHLALVLIGEGEADFEGQRVPGKVALERAGIQPLRLKAKEGLALINGTQEILAVGGLATLRGQRLCAIADITGVLSLEVLKGSTRPFDLRIQGARPHPGQAASANNLRAILANSEIMVSHANCNKVQDPYSLRCMPQVHGASRDALEFAAIVCEREICAATDNPLIFVNDDGNTDVISGGNFHGQPLAIALDTAKMGIAELGNIAERRIEQLVNPAMSSGLPPFLGTRSGLDSGFMMAQVTAAALVSENRVLCHPTSVDSIPSSAGKEDHVSMGTISARFAEKVLKHVQTILAIEALVAAQGVDLRQMRPGDGVAAAHAHLRKVVPQMDGDRVLYPDIEAARQVIADGSLLEAVEAVVGPLA